MCIICLEFDKLTTLEAVSNVSEMSDLDDDHVNDILMKIAAREIDRLNSEIDNDPSENDELNDKDADSLKALQRAYSVMAVINKKQKGD
ncbi:MAG: hypothetical protein Q8P20_00660 [bacterium]|nr:hypothetical protein [bacterium]